MLGLLVGFHAGHDLGDADGFSHGLGDFFPVPGQHDHLDARLFEATNRRLRRFTNTVAELQPAEQTLAFGHQHDRCAATGANGDLFLHIIREGVEQFIHQFEVAHGHGFTVEVAHEAEAGEGPNVLHFGTCVAEVLPCSVNGSGDGMGGFNLQRGGQAEQFFHVAVEQLDVAHAR